MSFYEDTDQAEVLKERIEELSRIRQGFAAHLGSSLYDATKDDPNLRWGRESLYDGIASCDAERERLVAKLASLGAPTADSASDAYEESSLEAQDLVSASESLEVLEQEVAEAEVAELNALEPLTPGLVEEVFEGVDEQVEEQADAFEAVPSEIGLSAFEDAVVPGFESADDDVELGEQDELPRCSVCGEPINPGDRFCMNCGAPIATAPVEELDVTNELDARAIQEGLEDGATEAMPEDADPEQEDLFVEVVDFSAEQADEAIAPADEADESEVAPEPEQPQELEEEPEQLDAVTEPDQSAGAGAERTCPVCGAPVMEGNKFCMTCGSRLDEPPAASAPEPEPGVCPQCGSATDPSFKFCMSCGYKLR